MYFAAFFLLLGGWFYFSFLVPPRYDAGYSDLEGTKKPPTPTRIVIDGLERLENGAADPLLIAPPTKYLITSIPSPTPTATLTPTPTVTPTPTLDAWATEYWSAEQTRSAFFTDRGVLAPATLVCLACVGTLAATLPPTPTRVWYNTPEPDFTPAIMQTHAMDATIQALIQDWRQATASAERSGERFSEARAPQAAPTHQSNVREG